MTLHEDTSDPPVPIPRRGGDSDATAAPTEGATGSDGAVPAEDDDTVSAEATGAAQARAEPHDRRTWWRRLVRDRRARRTVEWVALVALALGVAVLLRTFVVQSFFIPSESMTPTLQVGDRVLVNKLAYDFGEPARGDVVVFEAPPGEGSAEIRDLIKRVVALPGESVEGRDGAIYVNSERLDEPWLPEVTRSPSFPAHRVPPDHYWVLGDNRDDSRDSRFFQSIPEDAIVGKAFVRIWPLDELGGI